MYTMAAQRLLNDAAAVQREALMPALVHMQDSGEQSRPCVNTRERSRGKCSVGPKTAVRLPLDRESSIRPLYDSHLQAAFLFTV